MYHTVYRHRFTLAKHALMNEKTKDGIVDIILEQVKKPI